MAAATASQDLARHLVSLAEPGEQVEVCAGSSVRTEVRVSGGDVESLTVAETRGVGVRVISGGRQGFAHAGTWDRDAAESLVSEARDNMRFAEPDERVALAAPDGVEPPAIDGWDSSIQSTPIDDKVALAVQLEAETIGYDARVRGVRVSRYVDSHGESAIVSTEGIDSWDRGASAALATTALIDEDASTRTGAAFEAAMRPQDLDVSRTASLAVRRGLQLLGASAPRSGRPTVILEPRFCATLLGIVAQMLSGQRVVKSRTPFGDRVGESVAASVLSLIDDPTDPMSLGASAIDGEGLACRRVPLIEDGVLRQFLHDSHSARGLGVASTGSAVRSVRGTPSPGARALVVPAGSRPVDDIIADVDDGLLVASLQGLHSGVNAVSGDFSVGVEGIMIRDGELAEPIREATLAGTIPRLLLDAVEVSSDTERLPGGDHVPSLVVSGLSLSGSGA